MILKRQIQILSCICLVQIEDKELSSPVNRQSGSLELKTQFNH